MAGQISLIFPLLFLKQMLILRLEAKGSTLWGPWEAQGSTLGEELGRPDVLDLLMVFHRKMLILKPEAKGGVPMKKNWSPPEQQ